MMWEFPVWAQKQSCQSRTRIGNETVHVPWCSVLAKIPACTGHTGLVPGSMQAQKYLYFSLAKKGLNLKKV